VDSSQVPPPTLLKPVCSSSLAGAAISESSSCSSGGKHNLSSLFGTSAFGVASPSALRLESRRPRAQRLLRRSFLPLPSCRRWRQRMSSRRRRCQSPFELELQSLHLHILGRHQRLGSLLLHDPGLLEVADLGFFAHDHGLVPPHASCTCSSGSCSCSADVAPGGSSLIPVLMLI